MSKEDAHNQGQEDASKGVYNPPTKDPVTFMVEGYSHEELENIESYKEGYSHTESQKSGGGCFLTTACVEHAGLADDCHELTVLRSFRDSYVANLARGSEMLAEYYETAPAIVQQIWQDAGSDAVLAGIFATVKKAVELIEREKFSEAFACYEAMFANLKKQYHPGK